jgi:photosystem II stability/assembly factor-like uncharacterized protein
MKKYFILLIISIPLLLVSWEQIGPPGIEIRDIKVDEATGVIYVLSYDYMHLYIVDEETNLWEEIELPHPQNKVNSFDIHDERIYLTKDGFVYISEDIGETWDLQYFEDGCNEIFILPNHPNIVMLQRYGNVWFRSTDYGISWTDLGIMGANTVLYNEEYSLMCLASGSYFYKSTDLGETWELFDNLFPTMPFQVNCGIIINESHYIIGGIESSSDFYETIYETTDGGITWESINYGYQFALWGNSIVNHNGQIIIATYLGGYSHTIGLLKLDEEEQLWEELGIGFERHIEGTELYSYQNKLYWSSAKEGIFIYEDDMLTNNLIPDDIYKKNISGINFRTENLSSIFTSGGCLYVSQEEPIIWERNDSAMRCRRTIETEQNPPQWLSVRKDGLYISEDGEEWIESMEGIAQEHRMNLSSLYKLDDSILCYVRVPVTEDSFMYRSVDFGQTWDVVLEGNESEHDVNSINLVEVEKVGDTYYGTFLKTGIYSSDDTGATWEPVFEFEDDHYYNNVVDAGDYFYLVASRRSDYRTILYRTNDFVNWYNCTATFDSEATITDVALDPNNHQKIYAGIRSHTAEPSPQPHLMISEDSGDTWNEYYIERLDPKVDIRKVYTNAETNMLYVLPIDNSIMAIDLAEMNTADDAINVAETNLMNHPNPFNPSTTISFELNNEQNEQVQIEIYNIKGQLVQELGVRNLELGMNEVVWNAEKFASGVYFYKLNVDGKQKGIKKMLLLK